LAPLIGDDARNPCQGAMPAVDGQKKAIFSQGKWRRTAIACR